MRLNLTFTTAGKILGDGIDDIAPFLIAGGFDSGSGEARWTKAYIGMHTVEYSGVYCRRAICGDWALDQLSGGFWIWPQAIGESNVVQEREEVGIPAGLLS